jgi:hypothetical protein
MSARNGLMIGLPFAGRPVRPEWALTLAMMDRPLAFNYAYAPVHGKDIDEARNAIVELAMKHEIKYLFFLDDDVTPTKNVIAKFVYYLEQPHHKDVMVLGGIYCSKTDPPVPLVFKQTDGSSGPSYDWKMGDVFECEGLATGCMMIRMELFSQLEKPFFKTVDEPSTPTTGTTVVTDDLYFCKKVREKGFKIVADSNIWGLHWDVDGKYYDMPQDAYPRLKEDTGTQDATFARNSGTELTQPKET